MEPIWQTHGTVQQTHGTDPDNGPDQRSGLALFAKSGPDEMTYPASSVPDPFCCLGNILKLTFIAIEKKAQ